MRANEGGALQALGRLEEAEVAYREAERLAPRDRAVIERALAGRAHVLAARDYFSSNCLLQQPVSFC